MPGIFFGSKISGLCIFLGLQYEAPSKPPRHVYFEYPPWVGNTLIVTAPQASSLLKTLPCLNEGKLDFFEQDRRLCQGDGKLTSIQLEKGQMIPSKQAFRKPKLIFSADDHNDEASKIKAKVISLDGGSDLSSSQH